MTPQSYSQLARRAYEIACMQSVEQRRAALAEIPPDFQSVVRTTATNVRLVALHWRARILARRVESSNVPPRVAATLADMFPAEFQPPA